MIKSLSMVGGTAIFLDREEAGRQLAARLRHYREEHPLVLGLPRGGVAVAFEVARALEAPLDVWVSRKLGAPFHPELGIGAVAPGDVCVLDEEAIRYLGITRQELDLMAREQLLEVDRRLRRYRGSRALPAIRDHTVILVDDGLATGMTALAAVRSLRRLAPRRLVLAVPVCSAEAAAALRPEVDDLVAVRVLSEFIAVGMWYRRFDQLSDEQVEDLLAGTGGRPAGDPFPGSPRAEAADTRGEPVAHGRSQLRAPSPGGWGERAVRVPVGSGSLAGELFVPPGAGGLVLFAHGSGSSRHGQWNHAVAGTLRDAGLGTLLIDLLTPAEGFADEQTGHLRFDIGLLSGRVVRILDWLASQPETGHLRVGLFGASTGAAAALLAAAERPERVQAVVSCGGRPDLAAPVLPEVEAPALFLVGELDDEVLKLNHLALERLGTADRQLVVIPGATHLFEEPGALESVAAHARDCFLRHLDGCPTHREAALAARTG